MRRVHHWRRGLGRKDITPTPCYSAPPYTYITLCTPMVCLCSTMAYIHFSDLSDPRDHRNAVSSDRWSREKNRHILCAIALYRRCYPTSSATSHQIEWSTGPISGTKYPTSSWEHCLVVTQHTSRGMKMTTPMGALLSFGGAPLQTAHTPVILPGHAR